MQKKAVVFDFDGTLADSLPVLLASYNAIAPRFRLKKVRTEEIPELRKLSYNELFRAIGLRPFMLPVVIRAGTRELRKREDEVKLFKGSVGLLNALVKDGHQTGVLTSNHSDVVAKVLHAHGVAQLDFIVSQRSLFAKHKAFKKLEKVHSLRPEEIVYIGDESRDVVACRKAHVDIIGVTWGLGGKEAFKKVPPNDIATTMPELKTLIKKYLK